MIKALALIAFGMMVSGGTLADSPKIKRAAVAFPIQPVDCQPDDTCTAAVISVCSKIHYDNGYSATTGLSQKLKPNGSQLATVTYIVCYD